MSKVSFMANHICSFSTRGVTVRPLSLSLRLFRPFLSLSLYARTLRALFAVCSAEAVSSREICRTSQVNAVSRAY